MIPNSLLHLGAAGCFLFAVKQLAQKMKTIFKKIPKNENTIDNLDGGDL